MGSVASPSSGGGKEKNGIALKSSTFGTSSNSWSWTYTFNKNYRRVIASICGSGKYDEGHSVSISASLTKGTNNTMCNQKVQGYSPRYGADLVIVELLNVSVGDTTTFGSHLCYTGCYSIIGYE